jgi:hypothetical protein
MRHAKGTTLSGFLFHQYFRQPGRTVSATVSHYLTNSGSPARCSQSSSPVDIHFPERVQTSVCVQHTSLTHELPNITRQCDSYGVHQQEKKDWGFV